MGSIPPIAPLEPDSGAGPPLTAPTGPGSGAYPSPTPQVAYVIKPRPKWQALRTIAGTFKVLAWMTAGSGIITIIVALVVGSQADPPGLLRGMAYGVAALIGAGTLFLGLYSYAEVILVLICIEQNTRQV